MTLTSTYVSLYLHIALCGYLIIKLSFLLDCVHLLSRNRLSFAHQYPALRMTLGMLSNIINVAHKYLWKSTKSSTGDYTHHFKTWRALRTSLLCYKRRYWGSRSEMILLRSICFGTVSLGCTGDTKLENPDVPGGWTEELKVGGQSSWVWQERSLLFKESEVRALANRLRK